MTEQQPAGSQSSEKQPLRKPPLLVLIGPTAVGKTALSLNIAKRWNAEIVSGDSMQVYREMDIGTAKIKESEREGVPHHLIDIVDPHQPYSAADFQSDAASAIEDIASRGKLPFIVGGTGLYIESLCYNYRFAEQGSDEAFRAEQEAYAALHGAEALHAKLAAVDPATAGRLHPNDTRRVIRALEVHHLTGVPFSKQQEGQRKESPYELCILGLSIDRVVLYRRIEERIDAMLEEGLLGEVERLMKREPAPHATPLQALGYKELASYLRGECSYEAAVELLKRDTRRFAKRQLSWFRHMDEIRWFDAGENFRENLEAIHDIIAGKFQGYLEYNSNQSFVDGG